LLDAELLAEVYVELLGARQGQFALAQSNAPILAPGAIIVVRERPMPLAIRLTDDDRAAHREFIATLGEAAVWRDYVSLA
jgi:DNA polymerase-3 subunit epsilon